MRRKPFRDGRLYSRGGRFLWARVADEHGLIQRLSTRCTTEEAASAWADEYERKAADPSYRRSSETSLGDAIGDWLEELRRRRVSAATYEIAETKAGQFVRLWGESWPLSRIDNDLVLRFIDTREGEGVKPLTVKMELGRLKGFLEWARFRGTFARDLATVIPPRYSGRHVPRTRVMTNEEAMKLLGELDARRGAHVAFILATGARRGESFRARREDILLQDGNPHIVIRGTKTKASWGTVPVTGITHPFLVYAMQHAPGRVVLFDPWGKMVRDLDAACARAGIAKVSANDLRRTFGTWHRRAGVTAEQVAILLRHTTDTLAQTTYGRISGAEIGPRLRELMPVPTAPEPLSLPVSVLYAQTAPTTSNHPNKDDDHVEKQASPAGFGPATPALGKQETWGASRLGNSSAESSAEASLSMPNVSVLYATDGTFLPVHPEDRERGLADLQAAEVAGDGDLSDDPEVRP